MPAIWLRLHDVKTPVLTTERLTLLPFSDKHLTDHYVGWLNDRDVTRYSEQRHHRHDKDKCQAYARSVREDGHHFWAVEETAHARHVGNITASIDRPNGLADVAIMIGEKDAWGKGYGTEAFVAACRYLLGDGGMRKVTAGTMAANAAMIGIMRKAGMVDDGRRANHFLLEGKPADLVFGALFGTGNGQ
jgi:[ribosomal protein S5]-alanine N-acetyltransferase